MAIHNIYIQIKRKKLTDIYDDFELKNRLVSMVYSQVKSQVKFIKVSPIIHLGTLQWYK